MRGWTVHFRRGCTKWVMSLCVYNAKLKINTNSPWDSLIICMAKEAMIFKYMHSRSEAFINLGFVIFFAQTAMDWLTHKPINQRTLSQLTSDAFLHICHLKIDFIPAYVHWRYLGRFVVLVFDVCFHVWLNGLFVIPTLSLTSPSDLFFPFSSSIYCSQLFGFGHLILWLVSVL